MTDLISVTPIGLIEAPDLVDPLTEAGHDVVTGTGFRGAVRAIRERSQTARSADQVPVIIARWGQEHVGMAAWLNAISGHCPPNKHTVVLADTDDQLPTIAGAEIVLLPTDLSAVVKAAGLPDHPAFAGLIVAADGHLQWVPDLASPPFQMPDLDDGFDEDAGAHPGSPTPSVSPPPPSDLTVPDWAQTAEIPDWARQTATSSAAPEPVGAEPTAAGPQVPGAAVAAALPPNQTAPHRLTTDPAAGSPAVDVPDPLPSLRAEGRTNSWAPTLAKARPDGPAPIETGPDLMDLMCAANPAADAEFAPGGAPVRRRGQRGTLVISWAGKGGTGKTSIALALAQRAGKRCPDLRVAVIDANRGQADVAKYLRFRPGVTIPGIHDAAVSGEPVRAFLTAEVANQLRPGRWFDELHFNLVAGPRNAGEAHPGVVTTDVYAATIQAAQEHCDLVVVDTQIIEEHDTSGLIDGLIVPLLATRGVWGVANTDTAGVAVRNLAGALRAMAAAGVGRERMLLVANKADIDFSEDEVRAAFAPYTAGLERINYDRSVVEMMNAGRIPSDHAVYADALDRMLHRITGRPEFLPPPRSRRPRLRRRARSGR